MSEILSLLDVCDITTGKLDSNAMVPNGAYPFFTCAPAPLRIDTFSYDDDVILLAGNNAAGNFHCQRYSGKFDAYQRTYIITAKEGYDIDYIYYYLKLNLLSFGKKAQGSQTKFLTMKILKDFVIEDIPIQKQVKLSAVLKTIDAKIALNNQINDQLESMAKTLYDYWFVQFDFPDENGKPYKSSGGKMVYNDQLKREIPEGWGSEKLVRLIEVQKATLNPEKKPNDLFNYFSIPEFDKNGTYSKVRGEGIRSNKFIVTDKDILVSKLNPWFNRVIYNKEAIAIASTEFVVWQTKNIHEKNFLYLTAISQRFIDYCVQNATGTSNSHKRVNPETMVEMGVAFDKKIIRLFGEKVNNILEQIFNNNKQNQELTQLRDWLLPMLMNGQVGVK